MKKILFICLLSISSYGENLSDTCIKNAIGTAVAVSIEKTCWYGLDLGAKIWNNGEKMGCNKLYPFETYQGIIEEEMATQINDINRLGKEQYCIQNKDSYNRTYKRLSK